MSFMDFDENNLPVKIGSENYIGESTEARHSLIYILSDLADIKKSYFRLGFHLNEFKSCGYYKDFGYATMEEFAVANLGLDKSALSRCISVYYRFNASNDGRHIGGSFSSRSSMYLSKRYEDYSYSQLCEMVSLDNKELSQISPDMTVKEIREYKKSLKSKRSAIDDLNDSIKAVRETSEKNENVSQVATSQLEDSSETLAPDDAVQFKKFLSLDDLIELHGAASASKIRFASCLEQKFVSIYDKSGNILVTEKGLYLRDLLFSLLYVDKDNVVLRIESLIY